MSWRPLSKFVHSIKELARTMPSLPTDPREAAYELATRRFSADVVIEFPATVNVAGLAHRMDRVTVHDLRSPVPALVRATDLHSLPDTPPALFAEPFIIESEVGLISDVLGEQTRCLGCYELDGVLYIVGIGHPDGITAVPWRPAWGGGDIAEGHQTMFLTNTKTDDVIETNDAQVAEWSRQAARFLVVLGLLLEAAATPLTTTEDAPAIAKRRKGKTVPARPWAVKRVYLDGGAKSHSAGETAGEGAGVDGRTAAEVQVRGHLKRQAHGPGGKERRWVYVQGYAARRWVAAKPLRIVVAKSQKRS